MSARTLASVMSAAILFAFGLSPRLLQGAQATDSRISKPGATLTLGFHPNVVVDLPLIRAVENGDFARHGFDVRFKPYGRPDLILAALKSGEIQGSLGMSFELLLQQASKGSYPARGYLVWCVSANQGFDGFVTRADFGGRGVDDFQGKPVGVYPSTQLQFFVSRMLPNSTIKTYNPDAPFIGLDTGELAGVFVKEPFIAIARTKPGKYRVLEVNSISKRLFGGAPVPAALSVLSSKWIDDHPQEATAFIRLAKQVYLEYAAKRDNNMLLTEPRLGGFTAEVAAQVVEPAASFPEALNPADLHRYVALLEAGGLISSAVSFDRLFVRSISDTRP